MSSFRLWASVSTIWSWWGERSITRDPPMPPPPVERMLALLPTNSMDWSPNETGVWVGVVSPFTPCVSVDWWSVWRQHLKQLLVCWYEFSSMYVRTMGEPSLVQIQGTANLHITESNSVAAWRKHHWTQCLLFACSLSVDLLISKNHLLNEPNTILMIILPRTIANQLTADTHTSLNRTVRLATVARDITRHHHHPNIQTDQANHTEHKIQAIETQVIREIDTSLKSSSGLCPEDIHGCIPTWGWEWSIKNIRRANITTPRYANQYTTCT